MRMECNSCGGTRRVAYVEAVPCPDHMGRTDAADCAWNDHQSLCADCREAADRTAGAWSHGTLNVWHVLRNYADGVDTFLVDLFDRAATGLPLGGSHET